jgi:hypothetical protein
MQKQIVRVLMGVLVVGGPFACGDVPEPEAGGEVTPTAMMDTLGRPLGAISQRIVAANRGNAQTLNLVARLEVQPNELLEFYEPQPGVLVTSGAGAPNGVSRIAAMLKRGLNGAELWAAATDNQTMPSRLQLAFERSRGREAFVSKRQTRSPLTLNEPAFGPLGSDVLPRPTPPETHAQTPWCDTGFFETGYDECYLDFKVCEDNWWNGIFAYHNNTLWGRATVCAATGEMFLNTFTDDDAWPNYTFTVPQDTYRWRSISDGACRYPGNDCPFYRAEVLGASGKRFHFRFIVDEE